MQFIQLSSLLETTVISAVLGIALTACVSTQQTEAIDKSTCWQLQGFR